MDCLKSFRGYGKMNPADDLQFHRKTKTRLITLIAVTITVIIAVVATVNIKKCGDNSSSRQTPPGLSASSSIKAVCSVTRYPDSCSANLNSAAAEANDNFTDPTFFFHLSLSVASRSLTKLSPFLSTLKIPAKDIRLQAAVKDCKELLSDAIFRLNDSIAVLATSNPQSQMLSESKIGDLKTWLSAAITDQETCLDGFEGTTGGFREKLEAAMMNSTQLVSNSLAIATWFMSIKEKLRFPINRKLLGW